MLFRLLVFLVLIAFVGAVAIIAMSLSATPLLPAQAILTSANIERAQQLLSEHDPRKQRDGDIKVVVITENELTLIANHAFGRLGATGVDIQISGDWLELIASVRLPEQIIDAYVNIEATLKDTGSIPSFETLKVGNVSYPKWLANFLFTNAVDKFYALSGIDDAHTVIQKLEFRDDSIAVTYQWRSDITDAIRDRLFSAEDRARLRVYNDLLASAVSTPGQKVALVELVETLFTVARERSANGDAVDENRAAILVLYSYINGRSLRAFAPESESWQRPARARVSIHGRRDFAQHFSTSAALGVTGGEALANAVGLFKEIEDADGGSGFSFKDLAADMAGTRFGEVATASSESAVQLQAAASRIDRAYDLVPVLPDLEEAMSDAVFRQRYGGVGSDRYHAVLERIDRDIDNSPLY